MAAQHFRADAVEGAEPRHALDSFADHSADPLAHLPRGLVGEGDREDFRRPCEPRVKDLRHPRGQRRSLAGTSACEQQHRAFCRQHSLALRRVEAAQPWWFYLGRLVLDFTISHA